MANSREMGSGAPALSRSARRERGRDLDGGRASGLAVWQGPAWSEGLGKISLIWLEWGTFHRPGGLALAVRQP
jgi:hypothetical protein